jgi:phosphotriesterase-related protein
MRELTGQSLPQQMVHTARGPVPATELGHTLAHEHLFVLSTEFQQNYPTLWDRSEGVRRAAEELDDAYQLGVRTLVDLTVVGQGRDIELVKKVAAQTKVNIVVSTGIYGPDGLPPFLKYRGPGCVVECDDPATELLVGDVRDGIAGSGIRASLVKFASESSELDGAARRMAAVVADVHRETGVTVVVHSNPFQPNGIQLVELLTQRGVPPWRVVIGHAGDSGDPTYLRALAGTGCFIGFDRFGMNSLAPDAQRVAAIADLVERGHTRQLLLSQDYASHIDYVTIEQKARLDPVWSYTHLHSWVLAELRRAGVGDEAIETFLVDNPRRMLTGAGAAVPVPAGSAHGNE